MGDFSEKTQGVKCVILSPDRKKILLVKHTKGVTDWAIPGGKIESETEEECVEREMSEELGVAFLEKRPIGTIRSQINNDLIMVFECLLPDEANIVLNYEISAFCWFPLNKLPATLGPTTKEIINHFGYKNIIANENKWSIK